MNLIQLSGIGDAISGSLSSVWENISDSIWTKLIEWLYESIYGAVADFFTMISGMGADIFDLSWVKATTKLFSLFGWSMFVSGLVVGVFEMAMEYQMQGRINVKRQILPMLYGLMAVSLFTTVPIELYKFCITLQNVFSQDLSSIFGSYMVSTDGIGALGYDVLCTFTQVPNIVNMFAIIALGYCVCKIFFSNITRGGILLIQIVVGSLYMFSVPRGYTDGFIGWMKQVIALCLTAFLQITLLFLGLITWKTNMLLGIGVMMSANEVPRIAQSFGLDTSVKVNVMNAVHNTTTAINLTKAIVNK